MPTIPSPQGPQLRTAPLPNAYRAPIDVTADARRLAGGLAEVASVADRIVERDAQTEAWNAQTKIGQEFAQWKGEALKQYQGSNAKGYGAAVNEWWDKAAKNYGEAMSPLVRSIVSKSLAVRRNSEYETAVGHEFQQGKVANHAAMLGTVDTLTNAAISDGPAKAQASLDEAVKVIRAYGETNGLDVSREVMAASTKVHANIIKGLMVTDPKAAETYFTDPNVKSQIAAEYHDEISARINASAAALDGDKGAEKVWNDAGIIPGKQVELDKLEKQAREMFPGDKARQDAALAGLRQRTTAFEHSEKNRFAGYTGKVWAMIDAGASLPKVMATAEWQSLPPVEQHQIRLQLMHQAQAQEALAYTREQRALGKMRLDDEIAYYGNVDAYNRYSAPEVLGAITDRRQVEAMRSLFGAAHTQHLLEKWDQSQTREGKANATIDAQDFKVFAEKLGLRPDESNKSEPQKVALAQAQQRAETLVAQARKKAGVPLDREVVQGILANELARTVEVNRHWFTPNANVRAIQLSDEDLKDVVMTQEEKDATAKFMAQRYQAATTDAERAKYNPRIGNMREIWLGNSELSKRLRGVRPQDTEGKLR